MADDESPSPPAGPAEEGDAIATPPPNDATPTPAPTGPRPRVSKPPADAGGWSMLDSAVVILAIGVLALSVLGGFWLLGR
jgi:hypothetical protein